MAGLTDADADSDAAAAGFVASSPPALELRAVTREFAVDDPDQTALTVTALDAVDLAVPHGQLMAVTGASGSGKSTLLQLLGALDRPTRGDVVIDGSPVAGLSSRDLAAVRNTKIGFVFQAFNLMPSLSVEENVALPAMLGGTRRRDVQGRVDELLDLVGLTARRRRRPAQLSGGEQQRVAVARALVVDPPIVLADEPTGNLDTRAGHAVLDLLHGAHLAGHTVIVVTHDARIAAQCERVLHMRDGRITHETIPSDRPPRPLDELLDTGGI